MMSFNFMEHKLWQLQLQSQCQDYIGTRACALILMPSMTYAPVEAHPNMLVN